MAKLKAPLMSLGASGQLGKALVFGIWKGINVVREYVVPSNPRTASQTTHRGYFTSAVAEIHATQAQAANPLNESDQISYSTLAQAKGKIMTWFNQIVKLWVDVKVNGNVPVIYSDFSITDADRTALDISALINEETGSQLANGKFYFGTTKTNLIHSVVATVTGGSDVAIVASDQSSWMTAGVKYYVQFRPDVADPCEGADSGIANFVAE